MNRIQDILKLNEHVRTVAIAGHVGPDGDCVGTCTALWQYLRELQSFDRLDLYLELPPKELCFLQGVSESLQEVPESFAAGKPDRKEGASPDAFDGCYDLFISCDVSDRERIAVAGELFDRARRTVVIDHHVSNLGFGDDNYIVPDASACAEVLFALFDYDRISKSIAESLYTGIIHDSGVFQYSNTTPDTMRIAARLMEKGIGFSRIIEDSFNKKTFVQQKVLGFCREKAELFLDGRCICTGITSEEMSRLGVTKQDLEGIVSQLRYTEGVEAAVFVYSRGENLYKVSMRSNSCLDVSSVCAVFGGGGHIRAAGCNMGGPVEEVIRRVVAEIEKRL